jgi:hypothetical protein
MNNRTMFLECISDSIVDDAAVEVEGNWTLRAWLGDSHYTVRMYCSGFPSEVFIAGTLDEVCRKVATWYDRDEATTLTPSEYFAQTTAQSATL